MPDEMDAVTMLQLCIAALIGFLGLALSPLRMEVVTALEPMALVTPSIVFILLGAVPALTAAMLSLDRFRYETFATAVFLLGGLVSGRELFFGLFVFLSSVFASYKARSIYNGKNTFWTLFSVSGSTVFLLALVMGLFVGHTFYTDDGARDSFQSSLTGEVTDQAIVAVNATLNGDSGSLMSQQQGSLVSLIGQTSRNTSRLSIMSTRQTVMGQVDRAQDQFGLFSDEGEYQLLVNSFDAAEDEIPPRIADRIESNLNSTMAETSLQPTEDQLRQDVRGRAQDLFDMVFDDPGRMAAFGFIMTFSSIVLLKLPLAAVFGILAVMVLRMKHRVL